MSLKEVLSGKHKGKWRVQYTQLDDLGKKQRIDRIFTKWSDGKDFLRDLRHGAIQAQFKFSRRLVDWQAS